MVSKVLTSKEVCRLVGKSPAALRKATSLGTFPRATHRDGRICLWTESAVQGWIDSKAVGTAEAA